jgi:hypothetical protein
MICQDNIVTVMIDDKISKEYESLLFDIKYDKEQFKDNATIGLLLYRLAKERDESNKLFSEISAKLDRIASLLEKRTGAQELTNIVSDIDQKILAHIQRFGKVDAETIQSIFQYRGKNAASARLNALYEKGLLKKGRAGKKVFYWVNTGDVARL